MSIAEKAKRVYENELRKQLETFLCFLEWFGRRVPLQVIADEGRFPLLGAGLLEQRVLHIDHGRKTLSLD